MSVSDGLVGNIVLSTRLLPMDVDGLLPSTLLICDGFLCCCDKLWPSLIAIFFVVLFAKFHKDTELDSGTKECLKLLSYRNEIEKRWVVLCKGSKLMFSGFGTTVLKVLGQFDEWKQFRGDAEFVKHLVTRYDKKLREDGIFRNFETPKNDGLITDYIKCLDCSKTMDTTCFRLKCCCHQNHG
uniref:Sieve element occlusion C-terminal domain-containing protein n=1 Tax=Quercus lobata TaxID=97700 RepID=A0A7N2LMX5_QUELO